MKLAQIRDFLAVVESGSISAAARKLGVSQPGLTKSLGLLESELGASLLQRAPTGVTLTRQGQAFHVRARAGYTELAKAREELARGAPMQVGLGFGPFFAPTVVPQAVLRFREKFPDVRLRLVEGFRHVTGPMVRDGTLDISLAPRAPQQAADPAIRFRPIAHLDQIVVARRGHPKAAVRSTAALANVEWMSNLRREALASALGAVGVPEPARIVECESFNAMLALLVGSDMLAVVQRPFLDLPQVAGQVREVPISERLPGLTVGLHTRADGPLTRPAAALARLLTDIGRSVLQRGER